MPADHLLKYVDEAGDAVRKVIRAYHGSPYDFNRFDASKIGTGEGAQAYGHGLYFAGNEDVARGYRDRLRDAVQSEIPPDLKERLDNVWNGMLAHSRQRYEWLSSQPKGAAKPYPHQKEMDEIVAGYYAAKHEAAAAAQNPGRMYEVEIGHPENALLDWDRPLEMQNPGVLSAVERAGFYNRKWSDPTKTAGDIINHQKEYLDPEDVEHALLGEGIPGIKYLDGNSRRAGEGTRNYVMFPGTEDSIRILRKYGLLAPVAAGAATEQE